MKIVITGGHFSPAYSIISNLKQENELLVVGRKYAFEGESNETHEYRLCKSEGIAFQNLSAGRLQRKITNHTIPALFRFPTSMYRAIKILKKFQPDVVVTFGGYVGLPVAIAASILHIPVVLHEQTQQAGLSARLIGKFASVVCVSFNSSKKYFKHTHVVVTGNPIRSEIFKKQDLSFVAKKPIIYITGGSTGAHALNFAMYQILPELLQNYVVVHQTGNSQQYQDFKTLTTLRNSLTDELKSNYVLQEFFSPTEVAAIFQHAALVVSRSGINTIMELIATKTPALLIPLATGQKGEQLVNAQFFTKIGLGQYLTQQNFDSIHLKSVINDMIGEREKYTVSQKDYAEYIVTDAAQKIIEQIYLYGRRTEQKNR